MKSTKGWQIAGVIVGIISILFNLYQYGQKESLKDDLKAQAFEYALKLSGAYSQIEAHQRQVDHLHGRIENAEKIAAEKGKLADKYFKEYEFYKWQYDEIVQETKPLDLSDDEHVKFFLNWTSQ